MKQIRKRLTYANVMSSIAVFLVLGGATRRSQPPSSARTRSARKQLKKNAVTEAKVKNGAITSGKLADDAVITAKLANGAVVTSKIVDASITTGKLAEKAVTTAKLADNAVNSGKLADNAVNTAKLVDSAVNANKLAGAAVTNGKLADGSVTASKIGSNAVQAAQFGDINYRTSATEIGPESLGLASAGCNSGEKLLSIGYLWDAQNKLLTIQDSFAFIGGFVRGYNGTGATRKLTVQVACLGV